MTQQSGPESLESAPAMSLVYVTLPPCEAGGARGEKITRGRGRPAAAANGLRRGS